MEGKFTLHVSNSSLIICLPQRIQPRTMSSFTYQPQLRPALALVQGPKEYREERDLFIRIDDILTRSGLEHRFIELSLKHRQINIEHHSAKSIDHISQAAVLSLRGNIARHITQLSHRNFCVRVADSALLQWFLQIGRVDGVKAFAKSSSDRFAHSVDASTLHSLNTELVTLLANAGEEINTTSLNLAEPISFEDVYFDSTCLKAPIHFPVDWVLLRDAVRTLMKATLLIRKTGLLHRMPQEPLSFLSDINTLCMKMTAKNRTKDGKKHRKAVLREMKKLSKRVGKHASNHLKILENRKNEIDLTDGGISQISKRINNILQQLPAAIKQAHERIIGGRRLANKDKILSLYDPDVQVLKRGKSNAEVEFGNKLWLGETREGLIVDYMLEKEQTSDTRHVPAAINRLIEEQKLPIKSIWGDRGLHSACNEKLLGQKNIRSGLCPRDVRDLSDRLANEAGMREGLKRRAGTEARISILIRNFMGTPTRAKGFEHRDMMLGWAVFSHNLWVLARLKQSSHPKEIEPPEQIAA